MEPSLKVLLFAVAYIFVCMGICLFFKVNCYGEDVTEENEFEEIEFLNNLHNKSLKKDVEEEDYFHTEGSTYL